MSPQLDAADVPAKVLLVEDSEGDASLVMAALAESPGRRMHTQWESSLAAARAAFAHTSFDCIVVDLGLPDAEGLKVVDAVRESAADTAIVVLTGRSDDALGVQAIKHGADDYLQKNDLSPRQLRRSIDYAIERTRSRLLLRRMSIQSEIVMKSLGDAIVVIDAHGRVTAANPAAETLLRVSPPDASGEPQVPRVWPHLIHADGTPVLDHERPSQVVLATGEPVTGDVMGFVEDDGTVKWVELNAYPTRSSDGCVDGAVLSGRDITERLAAQETTRFQAALLEAVGQSVIVTDAAGDIIFWNHAAELTYGWSAEEALGRNGTELVPVESGPQACEIVAAMNAGQTWSGDFVLQRRDGSRFPALVTNTPVLNDRQELVAIIGVSTDITERKRGEESARSLSAIVESTADAIFTQTIDGTILTWNRGAEELYGYVADEVIGRSVGVLDSPDAGDELESILCAVSGGETVRALETVRRRRDGTLVDVSLTLSPVFDEDGAVVAASVIGRDITDRRRLEAELTRQAMYDGLTGLPNRTLLDDRLAQALAGGARRADTVAVFFVDLDQFKTVNDTNGHGIGDALLVEVAQRLLTVIRSADTVARFGGDEFVIVCTDTDADQAQEVADRIATALAEPMEIAGQRFYVTASIGIALTPPLEADADALLRYADAAMYDAKARGRSRARVFDASLATQSAQRLELTNDLREALADDALELHYQPVIELATGRLIGVEALTRWAHPVRGWVPPALFVPAAEDSGLIWALDKWVIGRACRDAAALRMAGVLPWFARVAVNVSARNVAHPELVKVVRGSAQLAGLPLDALELELTETGLMTDAPAAREIMAALRDLGVGIALDDFGTGYSSLTYVRQLPVTTIKIDRSFIQHISERAEDLAIAASVVDLARAIGLRVVAEGVETHEQLALLTKLGCGNGQGYLWSPAVPTDTLADLVRQHPDGFLTTSRTGRAHKDTKASVPRIGNEHGLHRLIEQHKQGASLTTIAAALNSDGYRTPAGMRWHATTVARALADGAYVMAEGAASS